MFFILSKTFWFILQPINLVLIALLLAVISGWKSASRWSFRFLLGGFLALLIVTYSPLPYLMAVPLEARFPPVALPEKVDGILVMGGGFDTQVSAGRKSIELDASGDRIVQAAMLAKRFPDARIVYAGGRGRILQQEAVSADLARQLLVRLGIEEERITVERQSRNTAENAVLAKRIANPEAAQNWVVITSAFHMPRTVGTLRNIGWTVIPMPVDFLTAGETARWSITPDPLTRLSVFTMVLREWIGLVAYRLTGRTDDLFPEPAVRPS